MPSAASRSCPDELEGRFTASTAITSSPSALVGQNAEAQARGLTPPVFIVVCNNTNVSKLVFDYIAGWTKTLADGREVHRAGQARALQQRRGRPLVRPAEHDPRRLASSSNRARR